MIRFRSFCALLTGVMLVSACQTLQTARRVPDPDRTIIENPEILYDNANLTRVQRADADAGVISQDGPDAIEVATLNIETNLARRNWREGEYWISRVAPARTAEFARWFEPRAQDFPPLWIYAAARRFEKGGNYLKAAHWYLVARERHIRHLRRCRDDTAKHQLTWADGTFAGLRTEMGRNPEMTRYAAKHGFTWLDLHRDTELGLLESCLWGERGLARARHGTLLPTQRESGTVFVVVPPPIQNPADWIIPAGEIHQIRTWSRILMKQEVSRLLGEPKEVPPTPTMMPLR